ncbi:MAG: hypothetical protein LBU07_06195 [Coriobacteriales bacterium]|nr:hypothetical protein [Coriobacteriales bacterium]
MPLTKQGYLPRIIDTKVADYLDIFGAVSIEGPKWRGKTWTALAVITGGGLGQRRSDGVYVVPINALKH